MELDEASPLESEKLNQCLDLTQYRSEIRRGGRHDVVFTAFMLVVWVGGEAKLLVMAGVVVSKNQTLAASIY